MGSLNLAEEANPKKRQKTTSTTKPAFSASTAIDSRQGGRGRKGSAAVDRRAGGRAGEELGGDEAPPESGTAAAIHWDSPLSIGHDRLSPSSEEPEESAAREFKEQESSAFSFRPMGSSADEKEASILMMITPSRPMSPMNGRRRWYCHIGACPSVATISGKCKKHHRMWIKAKRAKSRTTPARASTMELREPASPASTAAVSTEERGTGDSGGEEKRTDERGTNASTKWKPPLSIQRDSLRPCSEEPEEIAACELNEEESSACSFRPVESSADEEEDSIIMVVMPSRPMSPRNGRRRWYCHIGACPSIAKKSGKCNKHHRMWSRAKWVEEEGARPQSSAAATDGGKSKPDDSLRRGVWTVEEEEYAAAVIHHFSRGSLPTPLQEGTSLLAFLAEKLACSTRRVQRKFHGLIHWSSMKQAHHSALSGVERDKVETELRELEARFQAGLDSASGQALVDSETAPLVSSGGLSPPPLPQGVGPDAVGSAESGGETKAGQELRKEGTGLSAGDGLEVEERGDEQAVPLRGEASVEHGVEREEEAKAAAPGGTLSIGDEVELPNKRWRKLDDHFPADLDGEGQEEAVGATSRGVVVTVCSKKVRLLPLYAVGAEYMRGGKLSSGDAAAVRGFLKAYLEAYDAFEELSETLPREWAALARRVVVVREKKQEGRKARREIRRIEGPSYL